jgi:hypothetical protein
MWLPAVVVLVVGAFLLGRRRRAPARTCPFCGQPILFLSRTRFSELSVYSCGSTDKNPGGLRRSNECARTKCRG